MAIPLSTRTSLGATRGSSQWPPTRGPELDTWQVDGGGERFTFQSSKFSGALRPKVTIERGDGRNEWLVSVSGGTLSDLNDLGLNFPLTASLTLQPADQNSGLCTATEFASASN